MRTFDFTPLSRSSIGFDHLFDLLNNPQLSEDQGGYPPYDSFAPVRTVTGSPSPSPGLPRTRLRLPPNRIS